MTDLRHVSGLREVLRLPEEVRIIRIAKVDDGLEVVIRVPAPSSDSVIGAPTYEEFFRSHSGEQE